MSANEKGPECNLSKSVTENIHVHVLIYVYIDKQYKNDNLETCKQKFSKQMRLSVQP